VKVAAERGSIKPWRGQRTVKKLELWRDDYRLWRSDVNCSFIKSDHSIDEARKLFPGSAQAGGGLLGTSIEMHFGKQRIGFAWRIALDKNSHFMTEITEGAAQIDSVRLYSCAFWKVNIVPVDQNP
jgi:hypothetical protein